MRQHLQISRFPKCVDTSQLNLDSSCLWLRDNETISELQNTSLRNDKKWLHECSLYSGVSAVSQKAKEKY